jgi:Tfp pilus assembly protein PilF
LHRGNVYWQVNNLVAGAEKVASESFSRAMVLEPSNPLPLIQLGKLNIGLYDRQNAAGTADQAVDNLTAAEKYLTQAITLKQDYAPAHYYLAAVFERQGKLEEAVARLVALRTYRPSDIGLGFQLAMLYIRLEKFDLAQAELERIINLSPDYANARWYLAALYEKNSQFDKAIEQVNKVAELNHENQEVKNKLEQLRAGQAAAVIPEPVEEVGVSIETRQ